MKPRWRIREKLLARDGKLCYWCGAPMDEPTIEHLIPRSMGGTHRMSNLRLAHRECNMLRGADLGPPMLVSDAAAFADMEGRQ